MPKHRVYIPDRVQPQLDRMMAVSGVNDYPTLIAQLAILFGDRYMEMFSTTPDTTPTQPPPHQRSVANTAATATKSPVLGTLPTATTFTEPIQL